MRMSPGYMVPARPAPPLGGSPGFRVEETSAAHTIRVVTEEKKADPGAGPGVSVWQRLAAAQRVEYCPLRIRGCARWTRDGATIALARTRDSAGTPGASILGLKRCGLRFCPVCGPTLQAKEAKLFGHVAEQWMMRGGRLALVTPTTSHHRRSDAELKGEVDRFFRARTYFTSSLTEHCTTWGAQGFDRSLYLSDLLKAAYRVGEGVQALKASWRKLVGGPAIRWSMAEEATWNAKGGWHLHLHAILWIPPGVRVPEATETKEGLRIRPWERALSPHWQKAVTKKMGPSSTPHHYFGLHIKPWKGSGGALGAYCAGFSAGAEQAGVGKVSRKGSLVPFQLLDPGRSHEDRVRWAMFANAHARKNILTYSRGWRSCLNVMACEWGGAYAMGAGKKPVELDAGPVPELVGWMTDWGHRWCLDRRRYRGWVDGNGTTQPGLLDVVALGPSSAKRWWRRYAPRPLRHHALWACDLPAEVAELAGADVDRLVRRVLADIGAASEQAKWDPDRRHRMNRGGYPELSALWWANDSDLTPDGLPRWTPGELAAGEVVPTELGASVSSSERVPVSARSPASPLHVFGDITPEHGAGLPGDDEKGEAFARRARANINYRQLMESNVWSLSGRNRLAIEEPVFSKEKRHELWEAQMKSVV